MSLAEKDVAYWREWVGRSETRCEVLDPESLRRFAAALGEDLDIEHRQPSLAHWAFFLPVASSSGIGVDGHPKRGGFLPPVSLPRRMFAAADMEFFGPLMLGADATRVSTVRDLSHKTGRSGELVLVEVEHRIEQAGEPCVIERQMIVYREAGGAISAIAPVKIVPAPGDAEWSPTTVDLFRFSAVTFNSHRIHYDLPYATREEGYPGLVVHGPFTAARLYRHAARDRVRPTAFAFRAIAPIFCGQPVRLTDGDQPGAVSAIRCDGMTAMSATAKF